MGNQRAADPPTPRQPPPGLDVHGRAPAAGTASQALRLRYKTVAGNLRVKEVVIDDATMRDRFVICHNPEQAERDKVVRDALVAQLEKTVAESDALPDEEREEVACRLHAKPPVRKWLRVTAGGKLRIDRAAIRAEEHLDGKFLLRTSDATISAEDVALGYKQLLQVERGWRDMKSTLDLRPVLDRIRAHVLLCWLGLLLIRVAETAAGDTWRNLRDELERMHSARVRIATSNRYHLSDSYA